MCDMIVSEQESNSFEKFLEVCKVHNIEVVYNPEHKIDLKFRMSGQQKFARARTLGWYYETEQIKKRIDLYQNELIYQPQIKIIDTIQQKFLDSTTEAPSKPVQTFQHENQETIPLNQSTPKNSIRSDLNGIGYSMPKNNIKRQEFSEIGEYLQLVNQFDD